jgi:hypothetical protein
MLLYRQGVLLSAFLFCFLLFAGVGRAKEREGRGEGTAEQLKGRKQVHALLVLNWNGFIILAC